MRYILIALTALTLSPLRAYAQAPLTGFSQENPPAQSGLSDPAPQAPAAIDALLPKAETNNDAAEQTPKQAIDTTPIQSSKDPLEITADTTLEWLRGQNRLIARGNALAVQGASSIAAATLTADYREGANSNFEIHTLTANENVILTSQNDTAYGDDAVYDLDKGIATLTGQNLRLVSPDQTITARERFEYHTNTGKIHAIGNANVVRPNVKGGQDRLRADKITATLKKDNSGKQALDTIEAFQNVVITTPTEKVTGSYGIYRAKTNTAELKGGVTITRGPNILKGERAEVNLNTNTSKIFGNPTNNTRVRATFFPGSTDKN